MTALISPTSMTVEKIRQKIIPVLQPYGVTRVGLFGSAARGELRAGSDIDILVDITKNISLLEFVAIKLRLEEQLGRKVDLVEYRTLKPALKEKIIRQQLILL